jgi:hypothetical protein
MVVMGVGEVRVDLRSVDLFGQRLEPRRLEAEAAFAALADAAAPELGGFHDAELTATHYTDLRDGYLLRLRRLVNAVTAAQAATTAIAATYQATNERGQATLAAVAGLLSSGDRVLGDGPHSGR